jgi:hypothetical protein
MPGDDGSEWPSALTRWKNAHVELPGCFKFSVRELLVLGKGN